jgi:putative spermidine/putrescine transport system permease protein
VLAIPFVVLTVGAVFEMYEIELDEAAMSLGANSLQTFVSVTLPLIQPGILAGAGFAFITSFTQFTVSFFLYSGLTRPLPMWMCEYIVMKLDPLLGVISVFLVGMTLVMIVGLERLVGLRRVIRIE